MTTTKTHPESTTLYPSSDGKPVAETYDHLYAILTTLEVLRQYLQGRQATVLGNQFLYDIEAFPKLRVAPDIMVIFEVEPGGRDHYKIWQEGQVPSVIFEMTSKGTQTQDLEYKKELYEGLGVEEYWLFDPKGEWISEQLKGYRLQAETYQIITDNRSQVLKLRLAVEDKLIGFYREDNGEKLIISDELVEALQREVLARKKAEELAEKEAIARQKAEERVERLAQRLRGLGVDPDEIE